MSKITKRMIAELDPLIRPAVEILSKHGFQTIESCQGGEGHCEPEPIVWFKGSEMDLINAYEICLAYDLNVLEGRRVYSKCSDIWKDNDVANWEKPLGVFYQGPYNAIVFRMRNGSIFCA